MRSGSVELRPRLKDHDRGLGRSKRRVGVEVLVYLAPPGPQARPFVAGCGAGPDQAGPVGQADLGVRVHLQVEPPGRLAVPQPFIAIVTRSGPSSKYPRITLHRRPVRRPVAVSRSAPQRLPFGRHSPIRPAVTRYKPRCTDHAKRTIQRGGSRGGRVSRSPDMMYPFQNTVAGTCGSILAALLLRIGTVSTAPLFTPPPDAAHGDHFHDCPGILAAQRLDDLVGHPVRLPRPRASTRSRSCVPQGRRPGRKPPGWRTFEASR